MTVGWTMSEKVGVGAYNPRALDRLNMPRPTPILSRRVSEHAVLSADFRPSEVVSDEGFIGVSSSEVRVHVTYTDPPGLDSAQPIKLFVGTYERGRVDTKNERKDVLDEILASYPEDWAAFLEELPEAIKVAEVMLT